MSPLLDLFFGNTGDPCFFPARSAARETGSSVCPMQNQARRQTHTEDCRLSKTRKSRCHSVHSQTSQNSPSEKNAVVSWSAPCCSREADLDKPPLCRLQTKSPLPLCQGWEAATERGQFDRHHGYHSQQTLDQDCGLCFGCRDQERSIWKSALKFVWCS